MLAKMVIVDEQPFSIVEWQGFRDYVDSLQPLWQHISCFIVARDCMKIFVGEKLMLQKIFQSLKSRIALTTDVWTSIQT